MVWFIVIAEMATFFLAAVWHCLKQIDEDLRILWDWVNGKNNDSV